MQALMHGLQSQKGCSPSISPSPLLNHQQQLPPRGAPTEARKAASKAAIRPMGRPAYSSTTCPAFSYLSLQGRR